MAKFILLLAMTLLLAASVLAVNFGDCPRAGEMTTCTPKCLQDVECSSIGGICCPNVCNTRSCVRPRAGSQGSSSGSYKGSSSSTATGVYCGSTKCSAYEKCGIDKSTKKQKCVRS